MHGQAVIFRQEDGVSHSKIILEMVASALKESHLTLSSLDAIAVTQGPGSFTGLRIGVAVAQGLAYAHGLPIIPFSTLCVIAAEKIASRSAAEPYAVFATLDARMQQLYCGWYVAIDGFPQLLGDEHLLFPENVADIGIPIFNDELKTWHLLTDEEDKLATVSSLIKEYRAIGSGILYHEQFPSTWLDAITTESSVTHPSAKALVQLAEVSLVSARKKDEESILVSATELAPVYLRNQVTQ